MTKIAILGAGSVGCYLGACLLSGGANVLLLGRSRVQAQLKQYGLLATDYQGRKDYIDYSSITYSTDMGRLAQANYILVTVKSGDTAYVATSIQAFAQPNAIVVSFQNGIKNTQILHNLLPKHRIVKGMVPFNVLYNNKGGFHCGTQGNLAIEADKNEFTDLRGSFEKAQLPVSIFTDLAPVQWGKLIMNLNNAVNALSGLPLRDQLYNSDYRNIMRQVVSEALYVLKRAGLHPARTGKVIPSLMPRILALPTWLFAHVARASLKIDATARSSMYEDFTYHRKTEIDYLNGEIVSLGQQLNIPTPVNSAIVNLVKQAEQKAQGSPMLSPFEIQSVISNYKGG